MRSSENRKSEMYSLIERWRNSGKSQKAICKETGSSFSVFKYWHKKQKIEQGIFKGSSTSKGTVKNVGGFIPIKQNISEELPELQISYPNGVTIKCASSIAINQLKQLIEII